MCMYICIHTFRYVYTCTCAYIYTNFYQLGVVHGNARGYRHIYFHICMCVHVYIYMYIYLYIPEGIYTNVRVRICI